MAPKRASGEVDPLYELGMLRGEMTALTDTVSEMKDDIAGVHTELKTLRDVQSENAGVVRGFDAKLDGIVEHIKNMPQPTPETVFAMRCLGAGLKTLVVLAIVSGGGWVMLQMAESRVAAKLAAPTSEEKVISKE